MNPTLQLNFNVTSKEQIKNTWAFAKDPTGKAKFKKYRTFQHLRHTVITACSKEAKTLGIKAGMRYEDAKLLVPDMKVLVFGGQK